ncbi:MAG TPA: hypothetical protein VEA69_00080, partial [Tepidisphaeraceae bacterium]|nr:hypothetical protein [Tepidisphaeraceae bacterium]
RSRPGDDVIPLAYETGEAGVVIVSTGDDLARWLADVRCYTVRALIARPLRGEGPGATAAERLDAVVKRLEETVDPASWRNAGGSVGSMQAFGTVLVIRQTPANHERIAALLRAGM